MSAVLLLIAQSIIPWYLSGEPAAAEPEKVVAQQQDSVAVAVRQRTDTLGISLLLPFNSTAGVNGNMVDFYNGVLMAAKDLGGKGLTLNIKVLDFPHDTLARPIPGGDLVIGPVNCSDILARPEGLGHIISPLEPGAATLSDSIALVQCPTPAEAQIADNVTWVKEEYRPGDLIYVITPDDQTQIGRGKIILDKIAKCGLPHSKLSLNSAMYAMSQSNSEQMYRILIASENEYFVSTVLRQMTAETMNGKLLTVYYQSRLRSYDNLKTEYLHACNLHMSSAYFVDYSDEKTKTFVREYRALFDAEPNSFAFHGYDCLTYFAQVCRESGDLWFEKLGEFKAAGIQANFDFSRSAGKGKVNTAIRRVVYSPDFSITIQ